MGQHNAIFAGLKNCNGKIIVTMDDDGQNLPESIPSLINELNKGFDICYANYKNKKHNFFRKFGSYINNLVASILFDKPYNLVLTSFRCFTSDIKNEILKFQSTYIYLDGLIFSTTSNVSQIYVDHKEREIGKSNYTISKLFGLWFRMAIGFSIVPLRLASTVGILLSITSLVIAVWLIFLDRCLVQFIRMDLINGYYFVFRRYSTFSFGTDWGIFRKNLHYNKQLYKILDKE